MQKRSKESRRVLDSDLRGEIGGKGRGREEKEEYDDKRAQSSERKVKRAKDVRIVTDEIEPFPVERHRPRRQQSFHSAGTPTELQPDGEIATVSTVATDTQAQTTTARDPFTKWNYWPTRKERKRWPCIYQITITTAVA